MDSGGVWGGGRSLFSTKDDRAGGRCSGGMHTAAPSLACFTSHGEEGGRSVFGKIVSLCAWSVVVSNAALANSMRDL